MKRKKKIYSQWVDSDNPSRIHSIAVLDVVVLKECKCDRRVACHVGKHFRICSPERPCRKAFFGIEIWWDFPPSNTSNIVTDLKDYYMRADEIAYLSPYYLTSADKEKIREGIESWRAGL